MLSWVVHPLVLLNNTPLYGWTTFCSFIHSHSYYFQLLAIANKVAALGLPLVVASSGYSLLLLIAVAALVAELRL